MGEKSKYSGDSLNSDLSAEATDEDKKLREAVEEKKARALGSDIILESVQDCVFEKTEGSKESLPKTCKEHIDAAKKSAEELRGSSDHAKGDFKKAVEAHAVKAFQRCKAQSKEDGTDRSNEDESTKKCRDKARESFKEVDGQDIGDGELQDAAKKQIAALMPSVDRIGKDGDDKDF